MSRYGKTEKESKDSRKPLQQNGTEYTACQQAERKTFFWKKAFYIEETGTLKQKKIKRADDVARNRSVETVHIVIPQKVNSTGMYFAIAHFYKINYSILTGCEKAFILEKEEIWNLKIREPENAAGI